MNELLEQARANVAARYVEVVGYCPNSSTPVFNPCYRAIMTGQWDSGKLVCDELARLQLLALPENSEEG